MADRYVHDIDPDKYYSQGECAYILDCSISTISRLCKKRWVTHSKVVGCRIKGSSLLELMRAKEVSGLFD